MGAHIWSRIVKNIDVTQLNKSLDGVKTFIDTLFQETKNQYLSQMEKSIASHLEINNVAPAEVSFGDHFYDNSRISELENVFYDHVGFSLDYIIKEVKFDKDLYTSENYYMNMPGGSPIPGSVFSDIFTEQFGFWGYYSQTPSLGSFEIDMEKESLINKVYLKTNNKLNVTLYIKESHEKEWVKIDENYGTAHLWNFVPKTCISLKFESMTNLFAIYSLRAGLAKYNKTGHIISKPFEIKDLNILKLTCDENAPSNTGIIKGILVDGIAEEFLINNDIELSGSVLPSATGVLASEEIILPSGVLEDTINIKVGLNQWDIIETTDLKWETINTAPTLVSGNKATLTLSDEQVLLNGSLKEVKLNDTLFLEGSDYTVDYSEMSENKVSILLLKNSNIDETDLPNLSFTLLIRTKIPIKMVQSFVFLDEPKDIFLQNFSIPIVVRHVIINEGIKEDFTIDINTNNAAVFVEVIDGVESYRIKGGKGINLIEAQFYLFGNVERYIPEPLNLILKGANYYKKRYSLTRASSESELKLNEFFTTKLPSEEIKITTNVDGATLLDINYKRSLNKTDKVSFIFRLSSSDGLNTPTLFGYDFENLVR